MLTASALQAHGMNAAITPIGSSPVAEASPGLRRAGSIESIGAIAPRICDSAISASDMPEEKPLE